MKSKAELNTLVCVIRAQGRCECLLCVSHVKRCTNSIGHLLPNSPKWVHLEAVTRDGSKNDQDLNNLIGLCQNCLTEHRKQHKAQQQQEQQPEGLFELFEPQTIKETPLP